MGTRKFTSDEEQLMLELRQCFRKYPNMDPMSYLQASAQLVGNLIALQDATKYTSAVVLDVVGEQIELGNAAAITTVAFGKTRG